MANDVSLELSYASTWNDLISDDKVFADEPIVITRGRGLESLAPRPATLTAKLNNQDDSLRISNPLSPLYGITSRNIPIRATVDSVSRGYFQTYKFDSDETSSFRRSPRRGKAWTQIEAGGLLSQINQWKEPLKSPMTRQALATPGLIGFWPLDDDSGATRLSAGIPNCGSARYYSTVTLGSDEKPFGAKASIEIGTSGNVAGFFKTASGSGYQLVFTVYVPVTLTATYRELFRWVDSTNRTWTWEANDANFGWSVYNEDGTLFNNQTQARSASMSQWIRCYIMVSVSGATLTYEPSWWPQGGSGNAGTTKTFASSVTGQPKRWYIPSNAYTTGSFYSMVYAVNNLTAESPDGTSSFDGYDTEPAGYRWLRLMNELGLAGNFDGDPDLSQPMGPQKIATVSDLFEEIATTEDGIIYDSRDALELIFLLRNARYNKTATEISVTEMVSRPKEAVDDYGVRNKITAQNANGISVVVEDSTGPLGTQDYPDGIGDREYTYNINVSDELDISKLGEWYLKQGTINSPRYPTVTIDLTALSPARKAVILALDIGDVIEIPDYRENTIRLHIVGYQETIGWPIRHTITFSCGLDQQYYTGVYDSSLRRYDLKSSTLSGNYGPNDTTITFSMTLRESWSSTSTYDLMIQGERITIPAGAMAAFTGTGPYTQVATGVVRGVNGIRKSLTSGAEVHVATPGRYAR